MLLLRKSRHPEVRQAVLAGLIGGLAGAWAMSRFSGAWERVSDATGTARKPEARLMHASPQEWDSTANTASVLARRVLHRSLRREQRELGAVAVHYATGASMGAGYAVGREFLLKVWPALAFVAKGWGSVATGAVFGSLMWLCAQEIAMPVLHLSGSLRQYSFAAQAQSLGEHIAYGITTELARRAVQEAL